MSPKRGRNSVAPLNPAGLLAEYVAVFLEGPLPGPVLDLACGDGRNGIFLATKGLSVVCCDGSEEALEPARTLAREQGVTVEFWQADLEKRGENPLPEAFYGGILIFRYLHRPLIPYLRQALKKGGVLMYETFTVDQPRFGRPHNPDFLLKPDELRKWFDDWEMIDYFEGIKEGPRRAIAQLVCRKPT